MTRQLNRGPHLRAVTTKGDLRTAAGRIDRLFLPRLPAPGHSSISYVQLRDPATWIVLDRINEAPKPDYCIHGRVQCQGCGMWCWLGSNSRDIVARGDARPICKPCVDKHFPPDVRPTYNANDHRRADGPHD